MRSAKLNLVLGLGFLIFALFAIIVWIPLDTDTGLIEKVRRRIMIGDALAPTVAAAFIALGAVLLIFFERDAEQPQLNWSSLKFVLTCGTILIIGFSIMRYAGPAVVYILQGEVEYRLLRDTAPWKYIGFFLGSTFIITTFITLSPERFSLRALLIGIGATVVLILGYDLPFDDLMLPPNGDV